MDPRAREARELQRHIGDLLLRHRDPLGVASEPEAAGEYDAYVGPIYRLLTSGASERVIAEHLVHVEAESLGFEDTDWRMLVPVAHRLRNLYERLAADARAP
jgi:hypothetical protein